MRSRILALALLLSGCATMIDTPGEEEFARANATWTPNLEPQVERVADVNTRCVLIFHQHALIRGVNPTAVEAGAHGIPTMFFGGCSDPYGLIVPGRCLVVVPNDDPGWVEKHERRHCKYGHFHRKG